MNINGRLPGKSPEFSAESNFNPILVRSAGNEKMSNHIYLEPISKISLAFKKRLGITIIKIVL